MIFLKPMFPFKYFLRVSHIYRMLHSAEQTIPRRYLTIHWGEMTSQEGFHYNFHINQRYKSLGALEQFYEEPHWMHNLRQKLNLVTVPVFYLPFPALVYVRFLLSEYSSSQIPALFCRASLE